MESETSVTFEMSIKKETLERFRDEQLEDARHRLEIATERNLAEGIAIHCIQIKRFEKADYEELFRWFLLEAADRYRTD